MYAFLRFLLFCLPAELAHALALQLWDQWSIFYRMPVHAPRLARKLMGLNFANPLGLAAGFDKNASHVDSLAKFGFGFIEVGTVTPKAQVGNPRPRLFRLKQQRALINRMGFNNKGVAFAVSQLKQRRYPGIVGVNIGKNRQTSEQASIDDYITCLQQVYTVADYVAVNLSSPNTPGLRTLQYGNHLKLFLTQFKAAHGRLAEQHGFYLPIAVKVAPDLDRNAIELLAEQLQQHAIDAVIVGNTSLDRQAVIGHRHACQAGGLSGEPLREKANAVLVQFAHLLQQKMPIIAVGGIMQPADAVEKLALGASLVQVYTGLIYHGPSLIKQSLRLLAK